MQIRTAAAVMAAGLLVVACGGTAPRTAGSMPAQAAPAPAGQGDARVRHVEADVRFMQNMILHHRQAIEMTALVPERAASDAVRTLARRMELSQADEIRLMEEWLRRRGEAIPAVAASHVHSDRGAHHDHAGHGGHSMPGMLTAGQLERLASARGVEFDRLFLEYMILHHEGAIVMVAELMASPGAAQEAETFQFASHVDSDQRIEIERMRRMLSGY